MGGKEVAEGKEQGHPRGIVLTDPTLGIGAPMSENWFQFSVPIGGLVTSLTI